MSNSSGQKWANLFRQSPLNKLKPRHIKTNIFNAQKANTSTGNNRPEKTRSCLPWLKRIIPRTFKKPASPNSFDQQNKASVPSSVFIPLNLLNETASDTCRETTETLELTTSQRNNDTSSPEKDIVPLRQFLRYSMNQSDQRAYSRRRITRPFEPKYEIEWQKNQWLQLDQSTCQQIERLRQDGFSKIAIRKDTSLKKYIKYDNPNEMDVLLELSLHNINDNSTSHTVKQPEPISCHQPSHFSVRRTHWWQTSYEIGEASLPNWVDPDLCCSAVMMDAPSVLATISNYSRSSLNSIPRLPDTPTVSQKSSMAELHYPAAIHTYKPLKYTEPPFLMENTATVMA